MLPDRNHCFCCDGHKSFHFLQSSITLPGYVFLLFLLNFPRQSMHGYAIPDSHYYLFNYYYLLAIIGFSSLYNIFIFHLLPKFCHRAFLKSSSSCLRISSLTVISSLRFTIREHVVYGFKLWTIICLNFSLISMRKLSGIFDLCSFCLSPFQ